jgi:hypothetical protein
LLVRNGFNGLCEMAQGEALEGTVWSERGQILETIHRRRWMDPCQQTVQEVPMGWAGLGWAGLSQDEAHSLRPLKKTH